MSYENGKTRDVGQYNGLVSAPAVLAGLLLLLFAATSLSDDAMIDTGKLVILPVAAALAAVMGRFWVSALPEDSPLNRNSLFVLLFAVGPIALEILGFIDAILATTFAFMAVSTLILVKLNRNEEATILFTMVAGFHVSVAYAASMPELALSEGDSLQNLLIDVQRAGIAANFFSFYAASLILGTIFAVLFRGVLYDGGNGSLFDRLPKKIDFSEHRDILISSFILLIVNLIPLYSLATISDAATFEEHHYLGGVWALVTSVVVMFVAFCRAERWHVLGAVVAVNWLIYTLSHLVEIGVSLPEQLEFLAGNDFAGAFSWFFITFWLNVLAIMLASSGRFGDIAPRREPSQFRLWWRDNSYSILVGSAVIVGLLIRTGWNVLPAMNANITGLWDMTGGSDPWYMKRVVDYIVAEHAHFIFDADRSYPSGGINPRPPLFSWGLALGGLALEWLTGIAAEEVVWWSVAGMPAIFGALIVLPVAGIANRLHSAQAGIFAAWLMALMPGHISHSTFGLADHDSFALLFLTLAIYFWVRALGEIGSERVFRNPSANPLYLIAGIREMWNRNPVMMSYATLAGISFSTVALGWKGFVYGPGILFLAFAFQIVLNMFRRRDSLPLTSAALQMMFTTFLIPLPFYIWPGLNLLWAPSGFQPMFYIVGFTFALGWVASSFRDKPWLLVLGSGGLLFGGILSALWILQTAEYYDGWDILFTGGFYFSKNKIFGTIGEAQAPSRGVLFASFGPIVTLIALGYAFILLWRGAREEKQGLSLVGLWVLIASYMAWTAGRFILNATPAMAVVGAIGIAALWNMADFSGFVKEWRRAGIGTPRARFRSARTASLKKPMIPALVLVFMLVATQHATYGVDSGIPRGETASGDVDQVIYDITPDVMRFDIGGLSLLDSSSYNPTANCGNGCWYMGTFGPGFNGGGWNMAYEWLSEQDSDEDFGQRPAFVSWWDYGFQALDSGEHPTVADNFQSGIPHSGGMLLSSGQEDTLAMFIATLAQGDRQYSANGEFGEEFTQTIQNHLTTEQIEEFHDILSLGPGQKQFVIDRSLVLIYQNVQEVQDSSFTAGNLEITTDLMHGTILDENGLPTEPMWFVFKDGKQVGNATTNETEAKSIFDQARGSSQPYEEHTTHYEIGGYRYTADLIESYDDVSTNLHRANAKLGLSRAFLTTALTLDELVEMYHDISSQVVYEVQDYEGSLGETIERNNEIRYFAIDDRLYPLGGAYYADQSYHRGQTTGIFYAPTTLSGLDPNHYIESVYETQRGDRPTVFMTAERYEQEYMSDVVKQQSGAMEDSTDMIQLVDIQYQQTESFFETMVARIYVGYGTSSLGLTVDPSQPGPTWAISGTPGSPLENAFPLPGAMMNHFVIANWYDDGSDSPDEDNNSVPDIFDGGYAAIGRANANVKVVKYYSGATIEGTVELDGIGPVPNARILIERDAFSGEEVADENGTVTDQDPRTYWIPIGTVDADENGDYSFTVPAGKIRVSAFFGESDLRAARDELASGGGGMLQDVATESTIGERNVNLITGILGNVSGSQWLSETIINVSGEDGHSNGQALINGDIIVEPSFSTGRLIWNGAGSFSGQAITDAVVELSPAWDQIQMQPIMLETSTGSVNGPDLAFQGIGQVTFTGEGEVISNGLMTVNDFVGTHTQTILHGHSLAGSGEFTGRGTLSGVIDGEEIVDGDCNENRTMPENYSVCSLSDGDFLIEGAINATGRFTSNGTSSFSQEHNGSSLIGAGVFTVDASNEELDSYGTLNGTGTFSGEGEFSGPMVQAGTFHLIDAIPGKYNVAVIFNDGTRIEIIDGFNVPFRGVPSLHQIDVAGGSISGTLTDENGNTLAGSVTMVHSESDNDTILGECSEVMYAPCMLTADENGSFEFGPIMPGEYTFALDMDEDGFNEVELRHEFDAEMDSQVEFPTPIPTVFDLRFTLSQIVDGLQTSVEDRENLTLVKSDNSAAPVVAVFDNVSGEYLAELSQGQWILSHDLSDSEQLWEQIDLESDISTSFTFRESMNVIGTVYYDTNAEVTNSTIQAEVVDFTQVIFHWENFTTTETTDANGVFNVVLPIGSVVDAAVFGNVLNVVNGTRFTVEEGMENITMVARPGYDVNGNLNLNRLGNYYSSNLEGWEQVTVFATNDDIDAVWHIDVTQFGTFNTILPEGNWTFTTDLDWLNASEATLMVDGENDTVDMYLYPAMSFLEIDFFLDNTGDNNVTNGTPVNYQFSIVPLENTAGLTINVEEDGDEWISQGFARVPVEAGSYRINVELSNARAGDIFGTRIMTGDAYFEVGFGGEVVSRSIGFDPEWKIDLTFTNESGGPLVDQLVRFINPENSGEVITRKTDMNGTLIDHLTDGVWIVVIDSVETDTGVIEGVRTTITVSEQNANNAETISTSELASFSVRISDSNGVYLQDMDLKLTSNDELGTVYLDSTDGSGQTSGIISSGSWNIELNQTVDRTRYVIDSIEFLDGGLVAGENDLIDIIASTHYEMSGTIFWDHDDDDDADVGEGVPNVEILMTSEGHDNISQITNAAGEWSVFVPADTTWQVSTFREGFDQEMESIAMNAPNSVEIELTAGYVDIFGNVSHSELSNIGEQVELILIPSHGMVRDRVVPDKVIQDGVWNGQWTASVEPGRWIIRATLESSNLVGMASIDADISDGGNIDIDLLYGGWLYLSTQWLDFNGTQHHASESEIQGAEIIDEAEFILSSGAGVRWDAMLTETGEISILMPTGMIGVEGSFSVDQMGRVMEYSTSKSINVPGSGTDLTASVTQDILFDRISNHTISATIVSVTGGELTDEGEFDDVQATLGDEGEYDSIEFTMSLDYLGHETVSSYTVSGNVAGTDGQYWSVEAWDQSVENWTSPFTFEFGLDSNNSTTYDNLLLRITPANQSTAQSLTNGHTVDIRFTSADGYQFEQEVIVRIPQFHDFELREPLLDIYGIRPGEELSIPLLFTNSGNGDERFEFVFDDTQLPPDWQRTGATSHTVGAFVDTTHTIKVIAPENATGSEDFIITISVTDKNNGTYPPLVIRVKTSLPVLEISNVYSNGDPLFGTIHTFTVVVENTGLVDAEKVKLVGAVRGKNVSSSVTQDVLSGDSVTYLIDINLTDFDGPSQEWFDFEISTEGQEFGEEPETVSKRYSLKAQAVDDSTPTTVIGIILAIILVFVVWYFTRSGSRRPGAPF